LAFSPSVNRMLSISPMTTLARRHRRTVNVARRARRARGARGPNRKVFGSRLCISWSDQSKILSSSRLTGLKVGKRAKGVHGLLSRPVF
jgi:hypothetical protein